MTETPSLPVVVSVIVPSHNGRDWLSRALPCIAAGSSATHEIIVSDNGSSDDTAAWLAGAWPAARALHAGEAIGFAAACNRGAEIARGHVLVFLNNDTEAQPGWLDRLVAPVLADPGRVVTTALLVQLHAPGRVDSAGDGYAIWGAAFKRGAGDEVASYQRPGDAFSPCGAACAISRALFVRLGGFDEVFGSVCEDVDLGYRVRLAGGRCLYVPEAVVHHAGSATLGIEAAGPVRLGQRNLEWAWWANTPWALVVLMTPLHLLYNVMAAAWFWRRGRLAAFAQGKREALQGWRHAVQKRRHAQALRCVSSGTLLAAMSLPPLVGKWREKRFLIGRSRT